MKVVLCLTWVYQVYLWSYFPSECLLIISILSFVLYWVSDRVTLLRFPPYLNGRGSLLPLTIPPNGSSSVPNPWTSRKVFHPWIHTSSRHPHLSPGKEESGRLENGYGRRRFGWTFDRSFPRTLYVRCPSQSPVSRPVFSHLHSNPRSFTTFTFC